MYYAMLIILAYIYLVCTLKFSKSELENYLKNYYKFGNKNSLNKISS